MSSTEPGYTAADVADALRRLRALTVRFPEVTERLSHGSPTFFVRDKRVVCSLSDDHHGDGCLALVYPAPPGAQEELVTGDPRRFYRPRYVGHRGWVGMRLDIDPDWEEVAGAVEEAYRLVAPRALVRQLDEKATDG